MLLFTHIDERYERTDATRDVASPVSKLPVFCLCFAADARQSVFVQRAAVWPPWDPQALVSRAVGSIYTRLRCYGLTCAYFSPVEPARVCRVSFEP